MPTKSRQKRDRYGRFARKDGTNSGKTPFKADQTTNTSREQAKGRRTYGEWGKTPKGYERAPKSPKKVPSHPEPVPPGLKRAIDGLGKALKNPGKTAKKLGKALKRDLKWVGKELKKDLKSLQKWAYKKIGGQASQSKKRPKVEPPVPAKPPKGDQKAKWRKHYDTPESYL